MNPLFSTAAVGMLTAAAENAGKFFYEDWIIIKQLIWLFGKFMSGIMFVLDKMNIYSITLVLIIFTVVTKMILLPLTIKQQKVSKLNAFITPELQAIQKKYRGKTDQVSQQKMLNEQRAVQEKYGVSMSSGCLPTLIQFPILFALYPVVYHMDLYVDYLSKLKETLSPEKYAGMFSLFGIDLNVASGFKFTPALIIPVLVAVSQYVSTAVLTKGQSTPDSDENPMAASMKGMNYIMPIMLGIFAVNLPAFLGIYWIVQSLVMAAQTLFINKHLAKIPAEQLIQENIEKANKKRAKKGQPPLGDKATISTKNIVEKKAEAESAGLSEEEKKEKLRQAEEYYRSCSSNPGSLAAKANMVRDYNERTKK